jgi:hypothetical protein
MNVGETKRGNQEWTIQRHRQNWTRDTERSHTKQTTQYKKLKGWATHRPHQKPGV